jgi:alpha-L-fucosidase
MYDAALSDYKVTRTPFGRDPLRELADACARRGDVRLGFYVSLLDWHHPAYRFRRESGLAWSDYVGFLHGQVRELCTQFGQLACLWFDGKPRMSSPGRGSAWRLLRMTAAGCSV